MKIIVFSDSHGQVDGMIRLVSEEKPEAVIHCGDYAKDTEALRRKSGDLSIYTVCGNCDYIGKYDEEWEFTICGKKFFISHGHRYGVKRDFQNILYAGAERGADVVIFGHTHIPYFENIGGIYLINPGSITFGKRTYGIIDITEDSFTYTRKLISKF